MLYRRYQKVLFRLFVCGLGQNEKKSNFEKLPKRYIKPISRLENCFGFVGTYTRREGEM